MNGKLYKRAEAADFAVSLSRLMIRAGQVGLFRTMHKVHEAVRECGYEMAENIEALVAQQPPAGERKP